MWCENVSPDGKVTWDVFVGNLPEDAEHRNVVRIFSEVGNVASCYLTNSKKDSTKVAYVRYSSQEDAVKAIKHFNNSTHGGVTISVSKCLKKLDTGQRTRYKHGKDAGGSGEGRGPGSHQGQGKGQRKPNKRPDLLSNQPVPAQQPDVVAEQQLFVSFVEDPCSFWAQNVGESAQAVLDVTEKLSQVCPSAKQAEKPSYGKIYGCLFSEDESWYRCRILEYLSDSMCQVQYIDYGNCEQVPAERLVELPPNLTNEKPLCHKYVLYGVRPVTADPGSVGYTQGVEHLKKLTEGTLLSAKILDSNPGESTPVLLEYIDEVMAMDVVQEMINMGFVEKHVPPAQPVDVPNKDQFHIGTFSDPSKEQQGVQALKGPRNIRTPQRPQQQQKQQRHPPPQRTVPGVSGTTDNNTSDTPSCRNEVGESQMELLSAELNMSQLEVQRLQSEFKRLQLEMKNVKESGKRDLENLRRERDAAVVELATTKGKLKTTEAELASTTVKLTDANIAQKLKGLLAGVQKVKQLRLQFPSDDQVRDTLECGLQLVSDPNARITVAGLEVISEVANALNEYHTAQENIKACKAVEELADFISARDDAHCKLYSSLDNFILVVSLLPLTERGNNLQEVYESLQKTHGAFLARNCDNLELEEALEIYHVWKGRKMEEFSSVRTATNTSHNEVNSALRLIQQQLSLGADWTDEGVSVTSNLDALLTRFQTSIKREIQITDMEHTADASLITLTVHSVVKALVAELSDISTVSRMLIEYSDLKLQLGEWLVKRPDVSEIQAVRKNIKAFKSKLRHKLADKQDLEENEEGSDTELNQVAAQLSEIRSQLQTELAIEDKLVAELAELNVTHFPELSLQHPDLGIDTEVEYGGLVKQGRSLDYYDVKAFPGSEKKSLQLASCNNSMVVFKEYIVEESLGIKKGDFLRRAVAYHSVKDPHVLPLEAIFFVKSERQAYLQIPFHSHNLVTYVEEEDLSDKCIYEILLGVLTGLDALHRARLVHGAIHPHNVFINKTGQAVVADYDLTKTLRQRVDIVYTASNGLHFAAPEAQVKPGGEVSRSCDMYNFGMLALWIHFPKIQFSMKPNGIPDYAGLGMKQSLLQIVSNLLEQSPPNRLTTSDLLKSAYFCEPPIEEQIQLTPKVTSHAPKSGGGILKKSQEEGTSDDDAENDGVFDERSRSPEDSPLPEADSFSEEDNMKDTVEEFSQVSAPLEVTETTEDAFHDVDEDPTTEEPAESANDKDKDTAVDLQEKSDSEATVEAATKTLQTDTSGELVTTEAPAAEGEAQQLNADEASKLDCLSGLSGMSLEDIKRLLDKAATLAEPSSPGGSSNADAGARQDAGAGSFTQMTESGDSGATYQTLPSRLQVLLGAVQVHHRTNPSKEDSEV